MALEQVGRRESGGADEVISCSPPFVMDRVVTGILVRTLEKTDNVANGLCIVGDKLMIINAPNQKRTCRRSNLWAWHIRKYNGGS